MNSFPPTTEVQQAGGAAAMPSFTSLANHVLLHELIVTPRPKTEEEILQQKREQKESKNEPKIKLNSVGGGKDSNSVSTVRLSTSVVADAKYKAFTDHIINILNATITAPTQPSSASSKSSPSAPSSVFVGDSSVHYVSTTSLRNRPTVAYSEDFPEKIQRFSDWNDIVNHVASTSSKSVDLVTVAITSPSGCIGFIRLVLPTIARNRVDSDLTDVLQIIAERLGDHLVIAMIKQEHMKTQQSLDSVRSITRDVFPPHVAQAMEVYRQKVAAEAGMLGGGGATGLGGGGALAVAGGPAEGGSSGVAAVDELNDMIMSLAHETSFCALTFLDIVGFTEICSRLEPKEVMKLLNMFYLKVDTAATVLGVYKVR